MVKIGRERQFWRLAGLVNLLWHVSAVRGQVEQIPGQIPPQQQYAAPQSGYPEPPRVEVPLDQVMSSYQEPLGTVQQLEAQAGMLPAGYPQAPYNNLAPVGYQPPSEGNEWLYQQQPNAWQNPEPYLVQNQGQIPPGQPQVLPAELGAEGQQPAFYGGMPQQQQGYPQVADDWAIPEGFEIRPIDQGFGGDLQPPMVQPGISLPEQAGFGGVQQQPLQQPGVVMPEQGYGNVQESMPIPGQIVPGLSQQGFIPQPGSVQIVQEPLGQPGEQQYIGGLNEPYPIQGSPSFVQFPPVPGFGMQQPCPLTPPCALANPCPQLNPQLPVGCNGYPGQFVPICDSDTCQKNCLDHFGYQEGKCFGDECYCKAPEEDPWKPDYGNQDEWGKEYPQCAQSDTVQQSPINVEKSTFQNLETIIMFEKYDAEESFIVVNNGHGVRLLAQSTKLPAIQVNTEFIVGGVNLEDRKFVLGAIDLHWGSSEHALDSEKRDVELQFHHFDLAFDNFEEALQIPGAVLSHAVLYKIDENLSDLDEEIFERLANVTEPNSEGVIIANPIKLIDTSDIFTGNFGVYRGSMTFPPCEPNINWLVSAMPFKIRRDQVERLRSLTDFKGDKMERTYRDLQDIIPQ